MGHSGEDRDRMTVQTITTTGRGLSPTHIVNHNRRADAIMDEVNGAAGVLLWDGLYSRDEASGSWSRVALPIAPSGNVRIRPGAPLKDFVDFDWVFAMPWEPTAERSFVLIRRQGNVGGLTRGRIVAPPSSYLGFGDWETYSERDWLLFANGNARAVVGVGALVDEPRTSAITAVTDLNYMLVFKPSGNRLVAAAGSQSVELDANVTGHSDYDMCSASVGSTRYWIAAIVGSEIKLWSAQSSLATTTYATATLPTLVAGNRKLLLCAFPSGNVGACVIGYGTGGRPDVFAATYDLEHDGWSAWVRLNTDSDWGSQQPAPWVAWCRYPATGIFRLAMTRGSGGNNTTRIYEAVSTINSQPNAPTWVSPESGEAHSRATPLKLEWQFNDPDPGDVQTAYSVRRTTNNGTRYKTVSGWQTGEDGASKLVGPATSLTLTTPWASVGDGTQRYQVKTWDSADVVSPWSASLAANHGDPHNPTITQPAANATVDQRVDVTWTSTSQSAYRVEVREGATATGAVVSDSGELLGADRLHTVTMDATGVTRTIVLCTWSSTGIMSAPQTVTVTTQFTLPLLPTVALTELDADSLIRVTVTQAAIPTGSQAPEVEEWKVERRDPDGEIITVATGLSATQTVYEDRTPRHQADYDYRVTVTGDSRSNTTGWVT